MFFIFSLIALASNSIWMVSGEVQSRLTPLLIDIIACRPEYLENQDRYVCNSKGVVSCNHGWKESEPADPVHPCRVPICNPECQNGQCKAPNLCACEIGWKGADCSNCIDLPGCEYGHCEGPLTCLCDEGWTGAMCSIPECHDCVNGVCNTPNVCECLPGWEGDKCDVCKKLPGCVHGSCQNPNQCICEEHWTGFLCNEPLCSPPCTDNGECLMLFPGEAKPNHCNCNVGFKGVSCETCVQNGLCPGDATTCRNNVPNTCDCTLSAQKTTHPLCQLLD